MDEEKCARCGKRERMTRLLLCTHCGSYFCDACGGATGNLCPQCMTMLTRLS